MTEPVSPARIVVLVSGSGSNLQALLDACADPRYGARVVAVGADRDNIGALDRAAAAGVPTFVVPVSAYPTREDWDRALTARVAEHQPDLVVSAGFLKLVGAHFLAAFGGRYVNTHNSLLPAFPGIHGPRDALAYGVKVAGATLFFVDAGVDTGPIVAQVAVPVLDDDDEESLTERIKEAERRQLVTYVGRLVREGWTITGRKVTIGVSDTSSAAEGRRPIRRALVSVYDKTGLTELAQALHAAGVEIVSTGSTAATIEAAGVPVTPVEALTGFPETLDGRVKTLHPRVHAGLLADLRSDRHAAQLAELGIAVSCFAGSGTRWKTRMFAPGLGLNEDPATGSAAGPLAVHLVRHGRIGYGDEIEISQGAEIARPSTLYARVRGEGDRIDAVEVAGSAVLVARGEFLV